MLPSSAFLGWGCGSSVDSRRILSLRIRPKALTNNDGGAVASAGAAAEQAPAEAQQEAEPKEADSF